MKSPKAARKRRKTVTDIILENHEFTDVEHEFGFDKINEWKDDTSSTKNIRSILETLKKKSERED